MSKFEKFFCCYYWLCVLIIGGLCSTATLDHLELIMPRYAIKGGSLYLKCDYHLSEEEVHKVEWQKNGKKMVQFIKGRRPPFIYYSTIGATINKNNGSAKQIQLLKLDLSASGSYSCSVSMETPIFTKDSDNKYLTVIEPQERDPILTFNKESYEIGEVLLANCTSAPARPAPHLTWLINGQRVPDTMTKSYSSELFHSNNWYFERKAPSVKQLAVEVSELHVGDDDALRLSCLSTIPAKIAPTESYADNRIASVKIDIEMTESPARAISNNENYVEVKEDNTNNSIEISRNEPNLSGRHLINALLMWIYVFIFLLVQKNFIESLG